MRKTISNLMSTIVVPVMQEEGFVLWQPGNQDWIFSTPWSEEGRRKRVHIFLGRNAFGKYVNIQMGIQPPNKYGIMNPKNMIVGDENLPKGYLNGWSYEKAADVEPILQMLVNSLKTKGFALLEDAYQDPTDLFATVSEYMELYKCHEQYEAEFRQKHHMNSWNLEETLKAIKKELDEIPDKIEQEHRKQILRIAAAYGKMYTERGGRWYIEDTEGRKSSVILMLNKKFKMEETISPLGVIYCHISTNYRDNIPESIKSELKHAGYL